MKDSGYGGDGGSDGYRQCLVETLWYGEVMIILINFMALNYVTMTAELERVSNSIFRFCMYCYDPLETDFEDNLSKPTVKASVSRQFQKVDDKTNPENY